MTTVSLSTIAQPNPRAPVLIEVPETAVARLAQASACRFA
jgi:hypothetical protein